MTSSRLSYSLDSPAQPGHLPSPAPPSLQSAVTHLPVLALVNPRCCYTDAKWKSSTGLLSKHVVWSSSSSPSHRDLCHGQKRSRAFPPGQEGTSRPVCLKEATWGAAGPRPSSPSVPGPLGPGSGCDPCPRTSVPPASDATHTREAVCTARVSVAPNRDLETKCVLWPFHVCLHLILMPNSSRVVKLTSAGISGVTEFLTVLSVQSVSRGMCAFWWQRSYAELKPH